MTIAACYLSPEGVVLGADSTSTWGAPDTPHYFNHGQKLFEIGEPGTLGIVTWGMGGLDVNSHRMIIARFADGLDVTPAASVADVAARWAAFFWDAYTTSPIAPHIRRCQVLDSKKAHDPSAQAADMRSEAEEAEYKALRFGLVVGFCIAGYVPPDRAPGAYVVIFDPLNGKPTPQAMGVGRYCFWGAPNMIQRLIFGCDEGLRANILASGKWTGTEDDLNALVQQHMLSHPGVIPIRDAIDFVYTCIHSTIKALKFSSFSQICGGPIEVAVITADRKFRWVRHKGWDSAITDGGL